jgi:dTMP kinase
MKKYKLIIFEGIDGSGKSTQAKYFAKKLNALYFREPKFFKREILQKTHPLTELFLFLADRSEVYLRIKSVLKNKNVVLDRSFPSTLAYQLIGRNLKKLIPLDDYLKIDFLARQKIEPDLVIVFDVPVDIALKRLKKKTKFEGKKFLIKVRKVYLGLAKKI